MAMGLEFWPDDWGKKNRSKIVKSISSSRPFESVRPSDRPDPFWLAKQMAEQARKIRAASYHANRVGGRVTDIPEHWSEDPMNLDLIGDISHDALMAITPEEYEDDVNAFLYYGKFGLMDVTNTSDAWAFSRVTGLGYASSFVFVCMGGFLMWGLVGWWIDPQDKREGGLAETEWYEEHGPHTLLPRWRRNWERMVS